MLDLIKHYIKLALLPTVYIGGFGTMLVTIFKEARWGLFLLVFLIPQPNIWYKLFDFSMGKDFMDFLFLAVVIGMFVQKKGFTKTGNSIPIILFIIVSYLALWNSSIRFSLPLPISHSSDLLYEYKNYAQMIILYFLALNIIKKENHQKTLILIMSAVVLLIAVRSYRNFSPGDVFSWERRARGSFWMVGLGPNEMAAFFAHFAAVFLALFLFDRNKKRKLLFLATVLFSLHPLLFSYSRGAWMGFSIVMIFYGVMKKRSLLIVVVIVLLAWQVLLPSSVVERIDMTVTEDGQLEHSARGRPGLWMLAYDMFKEHPLFGVGYGGYSLIVGSTKESKKQDVHSSYMRILSEQGVIGFVLFLLILFKSFWSGFQLFKLSEEPFGKGLGFGFMGCVLATAVTNLFGDRWSYYVLGAYFWVFWGLVDRSILNIKDSLVLDSPTERGPLCSKKSA